MQEPKLERAEARAEIPEATLKTFYVTFGTGSIFHGQHAVFKAKDEDIVRRFMVKRVCAPWAGIYTESPKDSKVLEAMKDGPLELHYSDWRHV